MFLYREKYGSINMHYMSNYMAINVSFCSRCATSHPLEGLGEVCNYMFNRQLTVIKGEQWPSMVISGDFRILPLLISKLFPIFAAEIGSVVELECGDLTNYISLH